MISILFAGGCCLGAEVDTDGDRLPDSWELGFGRYEVVIGQFTWDEANVDAGSRGGHLATVVHAEEWAALKQVLGDQLSNKNLWLGGTEFGTEGFWHWVTNEDGAFFNWRAGEPSNDAGGAGGGEPELYTLQLGREGSELQWASAANQGGIYPIDGYVLERGLYTNPAKVDTDGNKLPDGAEQAIGHTYEVVEFPDGVAKSWHECQADAESRGGHLVTVSTLVEHYVVGHWIERTPRTVGRSPFGLWREVDLNSMRVFRWLSGEPFFFSLYDASSGIPSVANDGFVPAFVGRGGAFGDYYWSSVNSRLIPFSGYVLERDSPIPPAAFDTDFDTLADVDELRIWLTDPLKVDSDGDGAADGREVAEGTDPLNPNSRPLPRASISREGELCFESYRDSSYRIELSQDLLIWERYGDLLQGTGGSLCQPLALDAFNQAFWRIQELRGSVTTVARAN